MAKAHWGCEYVPRGAFHNPNLFLGNLSKKIPKKPHEQVQHHTHQ